MIKRLDLTIAIPVQNEERNLPGCLQAIGTDFARRIVVIDSQSTDNTRKIASDFGIETVNFVWNGQFPKKRNWFLKNCPVDTKWILFLDADEYLTPQVKSELRDALELEEMSGYWLHYTVFFMGKKLKGGYPLKKLALFKVGSGLYERIDEVQWSNLDMEVHEHPVIKGRVGKIKSKIDHHDFRGITHYIHKHNQYAMWEARRYAATLEAGQNNDWTWKQKLKYKLIESVWIGPAFFFGSLFFYGGIRDGARGVAFAILKMSYFNQIYCKIVEYKTLSDN